MNGDVIVGNYSENSTITQLDNHTSINDTFRDPKSTNNSDESKYVQMDYDRLIIDTPLTPPNPILFMELFLENYCKNNDSDLCLMFNACKNKNCSQEKIIDDNTKSISEILSQFGSMDEINSILTITDHLANNSVFILITVVVIIKIIIITLISYLSKKFNWCKRVKTMLKKNKISELDLTLEQELTTIMDHSKKPKTIESHE